MKPNYLFTAALLCSSLVANAHTEWDNYDGKEKADLKKNVQYQVEMQGSFSNNKTPFWLNANKYGLSSLEKNNGYLRAAAIRPLSTDSLRRWGVGYGVDVAVPVNYSSNVVIQQAFVEARWLHGVLSVGSKEYPMELKNQSLSTGSQTLGINARPVPQVRLALPDYWTIPVLGRWFHFKGHIAYGKFTDGSYNTDFATPQHRTYASGAYYHSKAGILKIGSEERFAPWSLEMGLEMASQFGGTNFTPNTTGGYDQLKAEHNLNAAWHAFLPGGQDARDGVYGNVEGNIVGSWLLRLNYENDGFGFHIYGDHFFEDHSQMLFFDYDGYGAGDEWQQKKDRRFYHYKLKDMLLGVEMNMKYGRWIRNIVFEYIYTKDQSGPYNHDHTRNIPDHLAGVDDYYNHNFYQSWSHWGQVMGNPLYRSPQYNQDGSLNVENNRFKSFHLGFDGRPVDKLNYRVMATYLEGFGRYTDPFTRKRHMVSAMVEAGYELKNNWKVKGAYGMDFGSILGASAGFQLTVSKSGLLKF